MPVQVATEYSLTEIDKDHQAKMDEARDFGIQYTRMVNSTSHDYHESVQVICRLACQGGAFDVDPQLASNNALKFYL